MNTIWYLDEAKKKLGAGSDYELDKMTGLGQSNIHRYRNGKSVMDDYSCAKIAEILELSPLEVIAAANAEREKDAQKRAFWEALREKAAGFAVFTAGTANAGLTLSGVGLSALTGPKTYVRGKKKTGGEGGI